MLGAFQSRAQMDEWSRAVTAKFEKVDYLINFVDDDSDVRERHKSAADPGAAAPAAVGPPGVDDAEPQDEANSSATAADTSCETAAAIDSFVSSAYVHRQWVPDCLS